MKAHPNFRILDIAQRLHLMNYERTVDKCPWTNKWVSKKDYAAIRDDIQTLREYKTAHPRKYNATLEWL